MLMHLLCKGSIYFITSSKAQIVTHLYLAHSSAFILFTINRPLALSSQGTRNPIGAL